MLKLRKILRKIIVFFLLTAGVLLAGFLFFLFILFKLLF